MLSVDGFLQDEFLSFNMNSAIELFVIRDRKTWLLTSRELQCICCAPLFSLVQFLFSFVSVYGNI